MIQIKSIEEMGNGYYLGYHPKSDDFYKHLTLFNFTSMYHNNYNFIVNNYDRNKIIMTRTPLGYPKIMRFLEEGAIWKLNDIEVLIHIKIEEL